MNSSSSFPDTYLAPALTPLLSLLGASEKTCRKAKAQTRVKSIPTDLDEVSLTQADTTLLPAELTFVVAFWFGGRKRGS